MRIRISTSMRGHCSRNYPAFLPHLQICLLSMDGSTCGELDTGELAPASMVQGQVADEEEQGKEKEERGRKLERGEKPGAGLPPETRSHGFLPAESPLPAMLDVGNGPTPQSLPTTKQQTSLAPIDLVNRRCTPQPVANFSSSHLQKLKVSRQPRSQWGCGQPCCMLAHLRFRYSSSLAKGSCCATSWASPYRRDNRWTTYCKDFSREHSKHNPI